MSDSSSNTKRRTWSLASLTLNSLRDLHRSLKVHPITSTFKALLVRNLAASTYSFLFKFFNFVKLILAPSISVKESFFQSLRTSSIVWVVEQREKDEKSKCDFYTKEEKMV